MTDKEKDDICNRLRLKYIGFYFDIYLERWGYELFIRSTHRDGRVRMFCYNDDPHNFYLEGLFVDDKSRLMGIGSMLLKVCEGTCISLNGTSLSLIVDRNSWMKDFYNRIGYEYLVNCKEDNDYIWVRNNLTK